jgi:hypothetical protein
MADTIITLLSGEEVYCTMLSNRLNDDFDPGVYVSYFTSPHQDDPETHWYSTSKISRIEQKTSLNFRRK